MRIAHPGCGRPAGGRGYNSGGNYCGGWAGNCGDGGVGGSSWYLICEKCREAHQNRSAGVVVDPAGLEALMGSTFWLFCCRLLDLLRNRAMKKSGLKSKQKFVRAIP